MPSKAVSKPKQDIVNVTAIFRQSRLIGCTIRPAITQPNAAKVGSKRFVKRLCSTMGRRSTYDKLQ